MATRKRKLKLQVLRRNRHKFKEGDIFALKIFPDCFHFGRVVRDDVEQMGVDHPLIYIYRSTSERKEDIPELSKNDLLVPPMIVTPLCWSHGYFEPLENRPLKVKDAFKRHCFRSDIYVGKIVYFDETGKRVPRKFEPCGETGIELPLGVEGNLIKGLSSNR